MAAPASEAVAGEGRPPPKPWLIATAIFIGMLSVVAAISPAALRVILRDGPLAALILLSALGLGYLLIRVFRLPLRGLLFAQGIGLGALSLLMLGLGSLGLLQRTLWIVVIAGFAIAGLVALAIETARSSILGGPRRAVSWLWLTLIPFGGLALLVSTFPPGTLWPAEGNGYDVLEYHLAAPREYYEAGRIGFLPHNIYSNFPFNVEMLYLLAMVLRGDPVNACFAAQLVNFGLGALAVAAIWKAARPWGGPAAMFAALLAASCPFMTYLCGLAYVENGLLLFTGLALAVLTANKGGESKPALAAGLFAGFACGCKYIAVPQVALPIGAAILWQGRRTPRQAARQITLYCVGVIVTFSPWLIKNAVFTGNPVFPLARSIFHERTGIWDDDGAARWQEGHLPGPEDRTPARRLGRLVGEVIVHDLYGISIAAGLIALVLSALLRSRFGSEGLLAPMIWLIAVSMIVWLFFTHLVDRFAIVLVPPCCVLAGVAAVGVSGRGVALGRVIIGAFVVVNGFLLVRICNESGIFRLSGARIDDGLELFLGSEDNPAGLWPTHEHVPRVNELAAGGRKVLMVGDARRFYLNRGVDYCVIFNRNPFAEVVADKTPTEVVEWLKSKGYSYVFVNWSEMRRLSKSRYGFWAPLLDDATWLRLSGVLKREKDYISGQRNGLYATLFRVP